MSRQVKDIIKLMEEIAPPHLAEPWDNVGLLVGSSQGSVSKIMVALDVTDEVLRQGIQEKVDLIISHHPVIFQSIKEVNDMTKTGSALLQLIGSGISVYSAHTNFDKAQGGTDDILAELLGLKKVRPLELTLADSQRQESIPPAFSLGRIGQLPEKLTLHDYLRKIKKVLGAEGVDFIGDLNREISTVASCAGAGGDFIELAEVAGADLFVTGEAKYHEMLSVLNSPMSFAAMGHYTTEYPAVRVLKQRLQNRIHALQWKIEVILSQDYGNRFRRLQE